MAKILSKTGITTSGTVQAGHVSQSIDAFAGLEAYDITLSGSFNMVSGSITGQPGVINNLTASYAIVALTEITKEVSSSFADTAGALVLQPSIVVTQITASSNISSSGTIVASNFSGTTSGTNTGDQNILNLAVTGSNVIFNNITASGDISSSGTIVASNFSGTTSGTNTGDQNILNLAITGSNVIFNNITASGDISSSGTIIGSNLSGTNTGDQNILNLAVTGSNVIFNNITASGDISSSGTITANKIESDELFSHVGDANTGIQLGSDTVSIEGNNQIIGNFSTTQIQFNKPITTNITASGNISSSGTIIANEVDVRGHITASGNISASGQVFEGTYHTWEISALSDTNDDKNWQSATSKGLYDGNTWNLDNGTDYDVTSDITQIRTNMNSGWRVPHAANYSASLKSMDVYLMSATNITYANDDHVSASLWYSTRADIDLRTNGTSTNGFTQRHGATAITTQCKDASTAFVAFNNYHISASLEGINIGPGSMVFPVIKSADGSTNNSNWNMYWIINYCKTPL